MKNNYIQKNGILIIIGSIIFLLLAVQAYFIVRDYNFNKNNLSSRVSMALNKSLDLYFTDIAKTELKRKMASLESNLKTGTNDTIEDSQWIADKISEHKNSLGGPRKTAPISLRYTGKKSVGGDSEVSVPDNNSQYAVTALSLGDDSRPGVTDLTYMVVSSLSEQDINIKKLSSYIKNELTRISVDIPYALVHNNQGQKVKALNEQLIRKYDLSVTSVSPYLKEGNIIRLHYPDNSLTLLKESLVGIFFSLLLSVCITAILVYLVRLVKSQRDAMQSNYDFISNMSHELRTPVTTSIAAVDGINGFESPEEKETAVRYLAITRRQLGKLHLMIDKILDTLSLESNEILLQEEELNFTAALGATVEKYRLLSKKEYILNIPEDEVYLTADPFHLENALTEVIENAEKYGGDTVSITLKRNNSEVNIMIQDSGKTPAKKHHDRIFDKFYRINSGGNRHDIKGYGIGLYYAKQIAKKHNGDLYLLTEEEVTTFKFILPNG